VTTPQPPDTSTDPPPEHSPTRLLQPGANWRFEKRLHVGWKSEAVTLVAAILVAVGISSLLIMAAETGVWDAYKALIQGAVGSRRSILESLVQATPLILTGLAAAVAFRARVWNIGGEGQFFAGAMGAWWVADAFGEVLPQVLILPLIVIFGAVFGALWGGIAGLLKARYGTNEIIVTVMMNFIILFILSWLLSGPWRSPDTFYFQTVKMSEATWLPKFFEDSRLHWGFGIAIIAAVIVYILEWKTPLGFEIRGLGVNEVAAKFKGISVPRTTIVVMLISGALAGLAGMSEVGGIHHRLQLDISIGYGFTGIIIALIGRLHPAGVVAAAIAFGALINGATFMQITTGTPSALVDVIQGLVLITVLVGAVLVRYRIQRVHHDE
jgi:simple sugar transport system permease protein